MFDIHRVELDWGGRKLVLETGKIARQADGAVVATYGESKVLATVVAATQDAVLRVESEAKELSEEVMLGAVMFGHRHFQPVIEAIIKLAEKAAKEPRELQVPDTSALEKEMLALIEPDLRSAYAIPN